MGKDCSSRLELKGPQTLHEGMNVHLVWHETHQDRCGRAIKVSEWSWPANLDQFKQSEACCSAHRVVKEELTEGTDDVQGYVW